MSQANILTQANVTAVASHADPLAVANALESLGLANILTQVNVTAVASHANPWHVAEALKLLSQATILTQESVTAVASHANPWHVASALERLSQANILTQANISTVASHANLVGVTSALRSLREANILTQVNVTAVASHANPEAVAEALESLRDANILTEANVTAVASHAKPGAVASVLWSLRHATILTQASFTSVVSHTNPEAVAYALESLSYADILTQDNFTAIASHANPGDVDLALGLLSDADILTEASFTALFQQEHQILLNPIIRDIMWVRLGVDDVRDNWGLILEASRNPNPQQALTTLTNQILGIDAANPVNAQINDGQSTHTASVHLSVSDSAARLFERYGAQLDGSNLDSIIDKINTWANALPSGGVNDAAKRCVRRLSAPDYTYTDEVSGVSTRQLLALSWLAMHDDAHREGSLDDALAQLSEGLYECQRGYNLSDVSVDNGHADSPICIAGTFNKLVEKLAGIHPDVCIKLITPKIATLKLLPIVKGEVIRYLTERANPRTDAEFVSITALLKRVEEDGVSAIWDEIKDNVSAQMFEEFGSLYINKEDARFTGLVDAGEYAPLGQLPSFQKELSESKGYRQYCSATLTSSSAFFARGPMRFGYGDQFSRSPSL